MKIWGPQNRQGVKGHQCLWPLTCTKNVAFRSNLSITMSARKHAVGKLYSRYGGPVLYNGPICEARGVGELQDAELPSGKCRRGQGRGVHDLREESGDDADMLRKQPPGVWRALFCSTQTAIIAPPLVIISAWGGGKAAHAADAPQTAIDRHGHLDCPHRGREASSSRSVAFPRLGGEGTMDFRFRLSYMNHNNVVFECAEGAVMRRCPCDVAPVSHIRVFAERRIQYVLLIGFRTRLVD
jgi:hypothetical protein